ncbi:MAG: hypothetical protein GY845_31005 [Planctomycetes bacterium]|nr:hypothetical protein [Planctomycetota bacterium]
MSAVKRDSICFLILVLVFGVTRFTGTAEAYRKNAEEKKSLKTNTIKIPPDKVNYKKKTYPCYPETLDFKPDIPSPFTTKDGTEILLSFTKRGKYTLIPVTVENGKPLHYSYRVSTVYGKDQQLHVDHGDFPTLARAGLNSEAELDTKDTITGMPVDVITYIGRPWRFSGAGFMAEDEDIISVLKGDNDLVRKLGLTHPQMARPLYHIWNIILKEIQCGRWGRFSGIQCFFYNGNKVTLRAESMKGWQISIFHDEIQGRFDIDVQRMLTPAERLFLQEKYNHLSAAQMAELEEKLTSFHFSEMVPYYIMRYGFYEGHTDYRADPIAIAWIFGFMSLEEIEDAFKGKLHDALTKHFTKQTSDLNG